MTSLRPLYGLDTVELRNLAKATIQAKMAIAGFNRGPGEAGAAAGVDGDRIWLKYLYPSSVDDAARRTALRNALAAAAARLGPAVQFGLPDGTRVPRSVGTTRSTTTATTTRTSSESERTPPVPEAEAVPGSDASSDTGPDVSVIAPSGPAVSDWLPWVIGAGVLTAIGGYFVWRGMKRPRAVAANAPSYKRHDPRGWGGDPRRGAALGRHTFRDEPEGYTGRIHLRRVRLNSGGYDSNGTYFGIGDPLYWYANESGTIDAMLRAKTRTEARARVLSYYPHAKIR